MHHKHSHLYYAGEGIAKFSSNSMYAAGKSTNSVDDVAKVSGTLVDDAEKSTYTVSDDIIKGTSKAAVEGAGNKLTTNEAQLKHMFRDAEGHFLQDNPANRAMIEKTAGSSKNLLGVDKYGNSWYAETLPNGTQAWAEIRNGVITEGGLNQVPKVFDPQTGLKVNIAP